MDKPDNVVDVMRHEIIRSTQDLIRIKSVWDKPKPGMPFGEGINQALEYCLKLGKDLGFKTRNFDGYAGHIEFGEGRDIVGVLVHLDVVPEGKGWTYPPYAAQIYNGKIYGRGAIDNKGPAVASIYALKALKDWGKNLNRRVRVILGTDEERGWEGIRYYLDNVEEKPLCGFSPDAQYPIINREKGILVFNIIKKFRNLDDGSVIIKKIKGGDRPNMVPDYCEAVLEVKNQDELMEAFQEFDNSSSIEIQKGQQYYIIKSFGKSAHGSLPHKGRNAVLQLFEFLSNLNLGSDKGDFVNFVSNRIGYDYHGSSLGIGLEDEVSGKLIFNVGTIDMNGTECQLGINIRYPVTFTDNDVFKKLKPYLRDYGMVITDVEHKKPLFIREDNFLINKLKKVYREVTGNKPYLISIGGGTYARAINNAVAFGPLFPGKEELAHQKDEYIEVEDLITNCKMFARAMFELAN